MWKKNNMAKDIEPASTLPSKNKGIFAEEKPIEKPIENLSETMKEVGGGMGKAEKHEINAGDYARFSASKMDDKLIKFLIEQATIDYKTIGFDKESVEAMTKLQKFREQINKIDANSDAVPAPVMINLQTEIMNCKYLIERNLYTLLAGQSYAFIFRKYYTAEQFTPTKDRLLVELGRKALADEVDGEIEKKMVAVRKADVAMATAIGRVKSLISWCGDVNMNLQIRIREKAQDRKMDYMDKNQTH
jgi:hypothetical protein